MKYVHLHTHSHFSLLDGLTKLDELVLRAKEQGSPAVGLTDHGVMYGAIEFYKQCKKNGIKPIIGMEAYLAPGSRFDKNRTDEKLYYHLLLLAKNKIGYKNLIKLTAIGHMEGYYYKPRIDWEVLEKHSEGLVAATACLGGEIPRLIISGKMDKARERIMDYNKLFGQGNFYLEIMAHPNLELQPQVNESLIKLSRELNVPLVATNDIHYLKAEDAEAQDILLCLQNKKKINDLDRMNMTGVDYSMRDPREISEYFKDVPEAIENTVKIADMCDLEIELGKIQLPHFDVPEGFTGDSYLRKLCEDGIIKRYGVTIDEVNQKIKDRIDYELSVIENMGWPSYFLIVADFVNWAKDQGIVVGPGRGSAAGSLICYLTGITNIDPLQYELLFERFLNPDRISMPDIDLDFADARREEVLDYVSDKYGHDHVAQIITFGTMAARAAIRDVGRVLDYPYDYCDKLAKMVPMFTTLDKAIESVPEVRDIYTNDDQAKRLLNFARHLEGVSRHSSTHACGVLITKDKLTENVPIQYASSSDKTIVSQYSLHPVEDLGLLKMDFLGLKNLTIIESAIKIIKNTRGLEIDIDNIPLDDPKAYELFQKGETTGVFQFESSGMKRYLKDLKPTEFEDIIAMVALYRPGPLNSGMVQEFIDRKHGKKQIAYSHEVMESALSNTYGVIVYQEQVMQLSKDMAGFTGGQADTLRKAMGKKIAELMAKMKVEFIDGCVKNRLSDKLAKETFESMEKFAEYGFNKSHAACYALVAYQTAYLKAHWPTEFMAALLTADQQNTDRIAIEIDECRQMGIEVKQPDVNQSFSSFTVVTSGTEANKTVEANEKLNTIRFGLKAIKNVGEHIADVIIDERKQNGPYKDLSDLLERVTDKDLNKKSLESLIKTGAMDQFGERGMLLSNIENILKFNKEISDSKYSKQDSLFGNMPTMAQTVRLEPCPAADRQTRLAWERELMGLYITEHPFSDYKKVIEDKLKIVPIRELKSYINEDSVKIAGFITSIKKIITRSGDAMLFVKIEDNTASTEILVFPKLLKDTAHVWQEGRPVMCQGSVSDKDNEVKLLANICTQISLDNIHEEIDDFKIKLSTAPAPRRKFYKKNIDQTKPSSSQSQESYKPANHLKIVFLKEADEQILADLRRVFSENNGDDKVYFKINHGIDKIIETSFKVSNTLDLRQKLKTDFETYIKVVE